jgi:hypothetical protein
VWSRFPFWRVTETPSGRAVTLGDMRFKDGPGRGAFRVTVETSNVEGRTSKEE